MGSKHSISWNGTRALAALRAAVTMLPGGIPLGALGPTRIAFLGFTRIDLVSQVTRPKRGDIWSLALRALGERYRGDARVSLVMKRRVYVRFVKVPRLVDDDGQDRVFLGSSKVFCRFDRDLGSQAHLFGVRIDHELPVAALRLSGVDLELAGIQIADAEVLTSAARNVGLRLERDDGAALEVRVPMRLGSYWVEEAKVEIGEARRYKACMRLTLVSDAGEADRDWADFLAAVRFGKPALAGDGEAKVAHQASA